MITSLLWGGISSPSPSYTQEVKVVRGKNLSLLNKMSTTNGGYINRSCGDLCKVKKGITYTLSLKNNSTSTSNLSVRVFYDNTYEGVAQGNLVANAKKAYTFTPSVDGDLSLNASISNADITDVFTEIMVEEGEVATSYMAYNTIGVKVENKNLLKLQELTEQTINGVTFTPHYEDGLLQYINVNGTATSTASYNLQGGNVDVASTFPCEIKAGTYHLSGYIGGTNAYKAIYLRYTYNNSTFTGLNDITSPNFTLTQNAKITSYIRIQGGYTANNEKVYPQLEKGTNATTYKPHQEQTYPISLGNIKLAKMPNTSYQDYFFKDLTNGKWYKKECLYNISNKTNWSVDNVASNNRAVVSLSGNGFPYSSDIGYANANAISNCFTGIAQANQASTTEINNVAINNANMYIKFADTINTKELVKEQLDSMTNLEIYYAVATPTDIEITDTTLISQLDNLYNAMSYSGQTNISSDGDLPFIISAEAFKQLS